MGYLNDPKVKRFIGRVMLFVFVFMTLASYMPSNDSYARSRRSRRKSSYSRSKRSRYRSRSRSRSSRRRSSRRSSYKRRRSRPSYSKKRYSSSRYKAKKYSRKRYTKSFKSKAKSYIKKSVRRYARSYKKSYSRVKSYASRTKTRVKKKAWAFRKPSSSIKKRYSKYVKTPKWSKRAYSRIKSRVKSSKLRMYKKLRHTSRKASASAINSFRRMFSKTYQKSRKAFSSIKRRAAYLKRYAKRKVKSYSRYTRRFFGGVSKALSKSRRGISRYAHKMRRGYLYSRRGLSGRVLAGRTLDIRAFGQRLYRKNVLYTRNRVLQPAKNYVDGTFKNDKLYAVLKDGTKKPIKIVNGKSYFLDNSRPPAGSTINTLGGIYLMKEDGTGKKVTSHNTIKETESTNNTQTTTETSTETKTDTKKEETTGSSGGRDQAYWDAYNEAMMKQAEASKKLKTSSAYVLKTGGGSRVAKYVFFKKDGKIEKCIYPRLAPYDGEQVTVKEYKAFSKAKAVKVNDVLHIALDVVGFVPGIGDIADVINAGIYALEKDPLNCFLSSISVLGTVGSALAAPVKSVLRVIDDAVELKKFVKTVNVAELIANISKAGNRVLDAIKGLVSSVKSKVSSSKWLKYFGLKGKMVSAVDGIKSKLDDAATALKRKIDEVIGKVEAACFVAGTKILTNKGYKSIENVRVGDIVLARDEVSGQIDYKPVKQVFVNHVDTIYVLEIDGVVIETTASHPFYVQGKGFVGAQYLKQTDLLLSASGDTLKIDRIEVKKYDELVTVYNFEVGDYHTYFASSADVFVHNTCSQVVDGAGEVWKNADLLDELASSGVKYNPDDVLAVTKTGNGKLAWLETGNSKAGMQHILNHADDFAKKGIQQDQIQDLVMESLTNGKIVGYQGRGTGRPIYEVMFNGNKHHTAITVGGNGFIVGANPTTWP